MLKTSISAPRSVVPRWRLSGQLVRAPEAYSSLSKKALVAIAEGDFSNAFTAWRTDQFIGQLADVFSIALSENRDQDALELAPEIIRRSSNFPKQMVELAQRLLAKKQCAPTAIEEMSAIDHLDAFNNEALGKMVQSARDRLRHESRNPLLWHDLAFAYNLLGESKKATRAMMAAMQLSDRHRMMVRSASRLWLHLGEKDRAIQEVSKGDEVRRDPWLLAAHVAVAQATDIVGRYVGEARRVIRDGETNRIDFSELRMAVATEELRHGSVKLAKKLTRKPKQVFTENALAQSVWLAHQFNSEAAEKEVAESTQQAYEADARRRYYSGDWSGCLQSSLSWLLDEPFSASPAIFGSFVASSFLFDFELGAKIAQFGLRMNPSDWMLKNNLIVNMAKSGRVREASELFDTLGDVADENSDKSIWHATRGLLQYERGQTEDARVSYATARGLMRRERDPENMSLLGLYQAIEEIQHGTVIKSAEIVRETRLEVTKLGGTCSMLLSHIEDNLGLIVNRLGRESPEST